MKKIIIILIAVVVIILIAFLGWYLFLRNPDVPIGEALRDILPFGSGEDIQLPVDSNQQVVNDKEPSTSDEFSTPTAKIFRISNVPVAGFVILTKNDQTTVRYTDRATGHIYDTDLTTLVNAKIVNQTLPKVYEAHFRPDGNAVLYRMLREDSDIIENLSLALTPPKATSTDAFYTASSTTLRGNIDSVTVGVGDTLFYVLKDVKSIVSSAFNSAKAKTLLSSVFTDWRLAPTGNNLLLYTKAGASVAGYAYTLNVSSGALIKILGPLNGLSVVSNDAGGVIYSYTDTGQVRLFAKNNAKEVEYEMSPSTFAEKCIWSKKKIEIVICGTPSTDLETNDLDKWYRGALHFSDSIWLFDTKAQIAEILLDVKQETSLDLDIVYPTLSTDDKYLVFINKSDLSLWALKLESL